jgi:hypothetical protein
MGGVSVSPARVVLIEEARPVVRRKKGGEAKERR